MIFRTILEQYLAENLLTTGNLPLEEGNLRSDTGVLAAKVCLSIKLDDDGNFRKAKLDNG